MAHTTWQKWGGNVPFGWQHVVCYSDYLDYALLLTAATMRVQVAEACGVSAATVEATYAEVRADLRDLLPAFSPSVTENALYAFPEPALKHMAKRARVE